MLVLRDNLVQCVSALRAHKLRTSLTMLGLTMGVATLITVMTIVQGANVFVEKKIANLGTNVFQIARTPFAVTDFTIVLKALKYKKIELDDMRAIEEGCRDCEEVGATASSTVRARSGDKEVTDVNLYGQTANMADIDTRNVEMGRYFTPSEVEHHTDVCVSPITQTSVWCSTSDGVKYRPISTFRVSISAMFAVCPYRLTSVTSLSPARARTVLVTVAPTSSQSRHPSSIARMSSNSIFLYFSAFRTMVKSVTANGVRAIWNTLVPRLAIFFSTNRFAPCTMVITVISVATPIVSPSIVSDVRSLCARNALKHCTRLSRKASMDWKSPPA